MTLRAFGEMFDEIEEVIENYASASITSTEQKYLSNIQSLLKTIGAKPGACKGCGTPVWWVTTKNGKSAPFTSEALNHFADCPKAASFRK